jgi:hypothetical protein
MYLPEHDSRHWPAAQNFSFLGAVFTDAAPVTPAKLLVSDMTIPSFGWPSDCSWSFLASSIPGSSRVQYNVGGRPGKSSHGIDMPEKRFTAASSPK